MAERNRAVLTILRTTEEPLTSHSIAKRVLAGATDTSSFAVGRAAVRIHLFLKRQQHRGVVKIASYQPMKWAMAD
jgi:hypothetical protein